MKKTNEGSSSEIEEYKEKLELKQPGATIAFRTHLFTFCVVNTFLFVLWFLTPGKHPWFLYPLGGWGIGIAHHFTHLKNVRFINKSVNAFKNLSSKGLSLLKKFARSRGAFRQHATAAISVSAYLAMINTITGVHFQWWLIPAAALGMGLSIHAIPHFTKIKTLKKQLYKETGAEIETHSVEDDWLKEAKQLEAYIRKELTSHSDIVGPAAMEILPTLEHYVNGIKELAQKKNEIENVLVAHPIENLLIDRQEMEKKQAAAISPALQAEYTKTLENLSRHEQSVRKLEERKELINLRLQSSLQSLRHLQLEIARIKTSQLSTVLEKTALEELRNKSQELASYIEDFDSGLDELN